MKEADLALGDEQSAQLRGVWASSSPDQWGRRITISAISC
jgi:hypothetical protein